MANAPAAPVIRFVRHLAAVHGAIDWPDGQLLQRFASQGDEDAFAVLVRRHGPMVLAACRRVLNDAHAAEDCFQTTFLTLARKAGSLRWPESLGPWLYGVASRTALKARAREARRRARERRAAVPEAVEPLDHFVWRDLRAVLDEAVQRLPDKYRVPFVLHCLQAMTVAEVARRLGCPQGTVAARLARARDQLRSRLGRRGLALSAGAFAAALAENAAAAPVPVPLLAATARAATVAAGQTITAGVGPAAAAALTQGGGKIMLTAKVKIASVMLLGFGLVAGSGAALSGRRDAARADAPSAAVQGRGASHRPPLDRASYPERDEFLDRQLYSITQQQADSDFKVAEFYRRTGRPGSACFYYELVCRRYPGTVFADMAGARLRELRQKSTPTAGNPLASVNGVPIFSAEVYAAAYLADPDLCTLGAFARGLRIAGDWKKTLDQLVDREVVVQDFRDRLTPSNPQFIPRLEQAASRQFDRSWVRAARTKMRLGDDNALDAALEAQGTSLAAVRRQSQRAFIVQEYLRSRVAPTGVQAETWPAVATRIVDDLKCRAVIVYGAVE
jgi:RNA polymerase sigma factor (sigma-70 family)